MSWLSDLYKLQKREPTKDIEPSLVDAIFRIYDRFPRLGLRERIGQQDMSLDIADAYINGRNAMIEAGVGIGKSFGYLIPSLLINQVSRQPVIIATSSIQLSEQIHKDLRVIGSRLGFTTVRSVVGKGMGQYACRHRAAGLFKPDDASSPLSALAQRILNYEIDERADIKGGISDAEWANVCVNDCKFERCQHKNGCLFYDMRAKINAKIGDIDFIIVNQDLLIRDLIKKKEGTRGIITERPALIVIDEAHNLEAKVRDAGTAEFTFRRTCRILYDALQILFKQSGDKSLFSQSKFLKRCVEQVFKQIEADLLHAAKQDTDRIKVSPITGIPLTRVAHDLKDLTLSLSVLTSRNEREIDDVFEAMNGLIDLFNVLAGAEDNYLLWASKPLREATVSICPKDISQFLKYTLFNSKTSVILTSATMCQGGETLEEQYAYLTQSLGFSGDYMDRQPSPFDYNSHAMMYISGNIPFYRHDKREIYLEAAYKEMVRLCNLTQGRTLVLFSAKEDMKYIYKKLLSGTDKFTWALHAQKEGSSQDGVIAEFRGSKGVLLSTGVFWEGVNIEGSDLSQVIIFRLPFPVPADPIYEYKAALAENPLQEVFVPDMLLRLRQGTGRLIRSETDLGVLSILDSRLCIAARKDYRDKVLETLPFKRITEDFTVLEQFVQEKGIKHNV
ncbi:ATP-dependent DNA helicase [Paenibacillus tianjinensis]|uniref:ATP-dependent DNA helicase n=1 Tax=Paenibacillus tianjinensis TaxID=2810347 RepID=A0ABX7LIB9_9BACL|nr:ATP-dependent DNA helicase [Paenibacillus tianjinensis]QSF46240.1 ATP-dependent DNA helicase [Paenibacillus tianjinensis]